MHNVLRNKKNSLKKDLVFRDLTYIQFYYTTLKSGSLESRMTGISEAFQKVFQRLFT